jgi:hypothetical protein
VLSHDLIVFRGSTATTQITLFQRRQDRCSRRMDAAAKEMDNVNLKVWDAFGNTEKMRVVRYDVEV